MWPVEMMDDDKRESKGPLDPQASGYSAHRRDAEFSLARSASYAARRRSCHVGSKVGSRLMLTQATSVK